jgi:hypothetical protein
MIHSHYECALQQERNRDRSAVVATLQPAAAFPDYASADAWYVHSEVLPHRLK